MKHSSELAIILNKSFNWSKPRVYFFAKILLALFMVKTVNLSKLASGIGCKTKKSSRYRRLQRFFKEFRIDIDVISRFIYRLFGFDEVFLTMDRTNWKWGKCHINILMVAIVEIITTEILPVGVFFPSQNSFLIRDSFHLLENHQTYD